MPSPTNAQRNGFEPESPARLESARQWFSEGSRAQQGLASLNEREAQLTRGAVLTEDHKVCPGFGFEGVRGRAGFTRVR